MVYSGEHVSPATLDPNQRVITVGTCSKTYAMTGWRVGWLVAPPALAGGLNVTVAAQVNNLPTFVQRAAEAALTGPQDCAQSMFAAYRERRDLAVDLLRARSRLSYIPEGAFYLLIALSEQTGDLPYDSIQFAEALIAERGIAIAPGAAFGAGAARYARISLASSPETLRAGINGLLDFAQEYEQRHAKP